MSKIITHGARMHSSLGTEKIKLAVNNTERRYQQEEKLKEQLFCMFAKGGRKSFVDIGSNTQNVNINASENMNENVGKNFTMQVGEDSNVAIDGDNTFFFRNKDGIQR